MKNTPANIRILPFIIAAALAVSCKSAPDAPSGANNPAPEQAAENAAPVPAFDGITGKDWKLIAVRTPAGSAASRFSRRELADAGMENAYTLRFDGERLSGMGAPNRYSAPYTQGAGQTLSVRAIAATLMASFSEPESLKEREFFDYLENAGKWDLVQGQLRLFSRNGQGEETVLVFDHRRSLNK
ncbi:MAG: META domain-containing protein [Treponema sp.]|jgi:heat shock protein HslJ|nr:META domain-containing protein [Treponema sp.]